jgi:hypothetical protein
MSNSGVRTAAKIGMAFWLLLSPGENWTWIIVGGHEIQEGCEQERVERLDGEYLVCASAPSWTARPDSPGGPGPNDKEPSPSLTRKTTR